MALLLPCCGQAVFQSPAFKAHAQTSDKPITRKGLEAEVKLGGLKPSEVVAIIKRRGVDFRITPDIEIELLRAGAKPEVIDAARANFKGSDTSSSAPTLSGTWAGSYRTCAQGQSNVIAHIVQAAPDDITLSMEIAMPGSTPGTFIARGALNPMNSFFAVMFTGWQHQPPGMSMGNIGGYVVYANARPISFSGIIRSPGCGQITLRKQ